MMLFPSTLFAYRPELRSETSLRGLHLYARIKTSRKWSYLTRVTRKPPPPQIYRRAVAYIYTFCLAGSRTNHLKQRWKHLRAELRKPDPVTSRWPRPLCGKHEHLDSASKTNPDTAGELCSTPPPPCSNRLTRHDCPSTGHVNQRLMQHSNAEDSTENVWTPSCQISHERHKDEISRRGVEFKNIYLSDRWDGLIVNDRYIYNIKRKIITITDKPRDRMDALKKQLVLDLFIYLSSSTSIISRSFAIFLFCYLPPLRFKIGRRYMKFYSCRAKRAVSVRHRTLLDWMFNK